MPEKACTEIWHYHPNHIRIGTSGEELTESHYDIAAEPNLLGFYRLTETVTRTNGKRDCAGELHETLKEPATRFIQFNSTKDEFLVCKGESLESCFGPFKQIPTPAE